MGASADWSHHQAWPGEPNDVAQARRFVAHHLSDHQLVGIVEDARLVVSELATNAVAHACTAFTVTLVRHAGGVEIIVSDGAGMPVDTLPASIFGLGGRGLQVVGHVSRDWGVRLGIDGGKSVWAVIAV
jgi:Histidine kinase-like ATPase domain